MPAIIRRPTRRIHRQKYSRRIAVDDITGMLRHPGIRKAHVAGCSMSAYSALQYGIRYPAMALSATTLGAGAALKKRGISAACRIS
ncbi:MAG: alpha/beta fold hydrolase [Burkholderiales bacterium]